MSNIDDTKSLLNKIYESVDRVHDRVTETQISVAKIQTQNEFYKESLVENKDKIDCLETQIEQFNGAVKVMKYIIGLIVAIAGVIIGWIK